MQIFANGKRHLYSFMEFCVIHLKNRGVKYHFNFHPRRNQSRHKMFAVKNKKDRALITDELLVLFSLQISMRYVE